MKYPKFGTLTKEKEAELLNLITESVNGEAYFAKKALLHMYDFLVAAIVSKYPNAHLSAKTLFKIGQQAVQKALNKYIENKRYKAKYGFRAYSLYFIKRAIERELRQENPTNI